ncbi:MAG: hypothetical protein K2J51_06495 [Alistipes sp.]|nr:hypothetical protein [Alistipes sp.]MDE6779095.1 hypothetical protein [Alistipes sp.]MDE6858354.1 hypothetical protein [Alistipes sp.]
MRRITAAAIAALLATSCLSEHQSFAVDIDSRCWTAPATLVVPNADTVTLRDVRLTLRHDLAFDGEPIGVTVRTVRPDSMQYEEHFVLHPSDDRRSAAAIHDTTQPYRLRVRFDREGDYRITLTPDRPAEGVLAVGVDIVKSKE